jgi:5'-AMP-activated protein kinase, regulatory beta subunit
MGNASGREEDAAAVDGDGADVEDGGGDSSVRSSERGFPPYGSGGANHVQRACSVGVVGGGGGAGSPPGSPGHSLSPRMFVPQVRSRDPAPLFRFACSFDQSMVWFPMLVCSGGGRVI